MVVALFQHGLDHQKMKRQFIQVTQAVQSKYCLSVTLTLTQQRYTSKCMPTALAEVFFVMHHQSKERNPLIHVGAKLHIIVLYHIFYFIQFLPHTLPIQPFPQLRMKIHLISLLKILQYEVSLSVEQHLECTEQLCGSLYLLYLV